MHVSKSSFPRYINTRKIGFMRDLFVLGAHNRRSFTGRQHSVSRQLAPVVGLTNQASKRVARSNHHLVGGFNLPLWKMRDFVNWDDEIPKIYIYIWKVIIQPWSSHHQPAIFDVFFTTLSNHQIHSHFPCLKLLIFSHGEHILLVKKTRFLVFETQIIQWKLLIF